MSDLTRPTLFLNDSPLFSFTRDHDEFVRSTLTLLSGDVTSLSTAINGYTGTACKNISAKLNTNIKGYVSSASSVLYSYMQNHNYDDTEVKNLILETSGKVVGTSGNLLGTIVSTSGDILNAIERIDLGGGSVSDRIDLISGDILGVSSIVRNLYNYDDGEVRLKLAGISGNTETLKISLSNTKIDLSAQIEEVSGKMLDRVHGDNDYFYSELTGVLSGMSGNLFNRLAELTHSQDLDQNSALTSVLSGVSGEMLDRVHGDNDYFYLELTGVLSGMSGKLFNETDSNALKLSSDLRYISGELSLQIDEASQSIQRC